MCIIIAKKAGTAIPKKETLRTCWDNNPDGAGYMFNNNAGKINIKKGFTTFDSFYYELINDVKKHNLRCKNVVIHFRIATSGGITPAKTHPFPISNNPDFLNALDVEEDCGVAHNGVLSCYTYNKQLSDSQNYIKDFLYYLKKINNNFLTDKNCKMLILNSIGSSKLAFLNKKGMFLFGDFEKDEDGVFYSNNTYKYKKYYYSNYWSPEEEEALVNYYNNYYNNFLNQQQPKKEEGSLNEFTQ